MYRVAVVGGLCALVAWAWQRQPETGGAAREETARQPTSTGSGAPAWSAFAALRAAGAATPGGEEAKDDAPPDPMDPADAWLHSEVMVAPAQHAALADVARRHDTTVARGVGASGFGALAVPEGRSPDDLLAALREDVDVDWVSREGRTFGATARGDARVVGEVRPEDVVGTRVGEGARVAGAGRDVAYDPGAYQWHLDAVDARDLASVDLRDVIVAVLDTGVAFEDRLVDGVRHHAAGSLKHVRFVAPWDFINGDPWPHDDHQHGTHIASLIASRGAVTGVAPTVSLMPLKVLDEEDVGTELALVEGIHWAVDHGADVINMSLSFGTGYVPSEALVAALERAGNAGVVLVSAAGNEGTGQVTQPAANPLVIAVGAIRPEGPTTFGPAPYGNASPRVDIVAPGGSVDKDRNLDGYVDGLLAETIALQDPTRLGYWLYAGTSQAAALVSGTAARLLGMGLSADEVRVALQAAATPEGFAPVPFVDGYGRGRLDVARTLALATTGPLPRPRDYFVSMLAWLEAGPGGQVRPTAMLTVLEEDTSLAVGVQVAGTLDGPGGGPFRCVVGDGHCRVSGSWQEPKSGQTWIFSADAVVAEGVAFHPGTAMFAGPGLQALVAEMRANADTLDAVLGFHWSAHRDAELGNVAAADLLVDLGVGKATSPLAMVMTEGVLAPDWLSGGGTLHISGGSGHAPAVRASSLPGPGAPWSLFRVPGAEGAFGLFQVDATALRDTPLALSARAMLGPGARGARAVFVGTGHSPGPVQRNRRLGNDLAGTPLGELLRDGGWIASGGQPAAPVLKGSASGVVKGR